MNDPPGGTPTYTFIYYLFGYLLFKWYYDQKIISFSSSDFESVFA